MIRSPLRLLTDPETAPCLRRPIVGWTFLIVCGTAAGFTVGAPFAWLLAATFFLLPMWSFPRRLLPMALLCVALAGWNAAVTRVRHEETSARLDILTGNKTRLRVLVSDEYRIVPRKNTVPYCRFRAEDAWLEDGHRLEGVNLTVSFYDFGGDFPQIGETWEGEASFHLGRYPHSASVSMRRESSERVLDAPTLSFFRRMMAKVREALARNLRIGVSEEAALRAQSMTIGAFRKLPYEERQLYSDTGIIHIYSISGLHVGIIVGILAWLVAWSGLFLRSRWAVLIPALVAYLFMTGVPPSATRACAMAGIYCFAPCFMRKPDTTTAFFVTLAGCMIFAPEWISHIGALLSFSAIGGILLFYSPLNYFTNRLLRSHPQRNALGDLPRKTPLHVRLRRSVAAVLALTLSAWVATLPLSLYFFGRVSLGGLLLNLFVPTLAVAVVWLSVISAVAGFLIPWVSAILNVLTDSILRFTHDTAEAVARSPWCVATLEVPAGYLSTLVLGSGLIFLGLWLRALERAWRNADPRDPTVFRFVV